MKRGIVFALLLSLLLSGCSLLDQDYGSVEPHANRYWEEGAGSDVLRAESYQDLVNILMLLVEEHDESGLIRLYLTDVDYLSALTMMQRAAAEVRGETAIGSYALDRLDFTVEELRNSYYQVELHPLYRRTAEDVASIQDTASSGAIYDMLLKAYEEEAPRLTVRCSYLAEEPEVLLENIRLLQAELEGFARPVLLPPGGEEGENGEGTPGEPPPENPGEPENPENGEGEAEDEPAEEPVLWEVYFYPPQGDWSIIEIYLQPESPVEPAEP